MKLPTIVSPPLLRSLPLGSWAAILHLLSVSGPAAIIRRVRSVVVDPFDRMACWSWTHVMHEICEASTPAFADRYPSLAVVVIAVVIWIGAAGFHASPNEVFVSAGSSMRAVSVNAPFTLKASATLSSACPHMVRSTDLCFAAVASEEPLLVGPYRDLPDGGQTSMPIARCHEFAGGMVTCG